MRRSAIVMAVLFLSAACGGGDSPTAPVTPVPVQITMTPVSMVLTVGQTASFVASVSGSTNTGVSYASSAPAIAGVNGSGAVSAIAAGSATITATANADPTKLATSTVTVQSGSVPIPISISIVPVGATTFSAGGTLQLTSTITGSTNPGVTWSTSAPGVATVSATGLVTGVSSGTATITGAAAADPSKSAAITVTVTPVVPAADYTLSVPIFASVEMGRSVALPVTITRLSGHTEKIAVSAASSASLTLSVSPDTVAAGSAATTVNVTAPLSNTWGTYPVVVTGRDAGNRVRMDTVLLSVLPPGSGSVVAATAGTPVTNISGAEDSYKFYRITVVPGATRLVVRTAGSNGDADLVIRFGAVPNAQQFDCADANETSHEECVIATPQAGDWYVLLYGYEAYTGLTLTTTVDVGPVTTPAIALSAGTSATTLVRGATATIPLTVARSGGFAGAVDLTVEGLPAGVTAAFVPSTLNASQTTSVLTLTGGAAATLGTSNITVRARGTGVTDRTVTNALTVVAVQTVGISVSPTTESLTVGGTRQLSATVTGTTNTAVSWTTSNAGIAAVSGAGLVTATGAGSATITARSSADATKTATAVITVTAGGGGGFTGRVASFTVYDLSTTPALQGKLPDTDIYATRGSIYFKMFDQNGGSDAVAKFRPGGAFRMDSPVPDIRFYTPSRSLNDPADVSSFYYLGVKSNGEREMGMYNINNGSPSFTTRDDIGGSVNADLRLEQLIPTGETDPTGILWAITRDNYILQDDRTRTSSNTTSDIFGDTIAKLTYGASVHAESRMDDLILYVAENSKLHIVSSAGIDRTFNLGATYGGAWYVEGLTSFDNRLWFSYGDRVMRYRDGSLQQITTASSSPFSFGGGNFCTNGSSLYTASGMVLNADGGTERSFVSQTGTLSTADQIKLGELQSAVSIGRLICLRGSSPYVYVMSGSKLYEITPL